MGRDKLIKIVSAIAIASVAFTVASASNEKTTLKPDHNSINISGNGIYTERTPYQWALVRLDFVRREKVQKLRNFCSKLHTLAQKAKDDEFLNACFDINLKFQQTQVEKNTPKELIDKVNELRAALNAYYIQEYYSFYDILFIDDNSQIFYTLRKESDNSSNLMAHVIKDTPLAKCINSAPKQESFVDFHNYGPSNEPAAFIVEPVFKNGQLNGYIALQCAANKLDSLFAWTEELGKTGETFLVNTDGFMLTESNFEGVSTILKKKLDDRNIKAKFSDGQGHRVVTDYRDCTALSSFEVVPFLNTKWLVVAKMDKDEIITNHYRQHQKYFGQTLLTKLKESPIQSHSSNMDFPAQSPIRIDMDEFIKADNGELLETFGISTCTGLLITYPGKFAYMAHISPQDSIYGNSQSNLLQQMLKKITIFDIYPCEKRKLKFVLVANHLDSTLQAVDKLLNEGFMLSQIQIMYNPQAFSARVNYDYTKNTLIVNWKNNTNSFCYNNFNDTANIGQIIEEVMTVNN